MQSIIQEALIDANDRSEIINLYPVSGGSINESFYVETGKQKYFIKYHQNSPSNFFHLEKIGLDYIKETGSINVPNVYAYSDVLGQSFLVLEWVEGKSTNQTGTLLGKRIAQMHQSTSSQHGLSGSTYVGTIEQNNSLYEEWLDYYRDCRLSGQLKIGIKQNYIKGKRRDRLGKLMTQLDHWIPKGINPSYLHGDLWGGNWLPGPNGNPYVIDPSFLFGDRHFDLAFTELFGGFPKEFIEAYEHYHPTEPYYADIKELYQLYYLLVHLNIFGETYGGSVDRILKRYVG